MALSKEVRITYKVDQRQAKVGSEAVKKAQDEIADAVKEATKRFKEFDNASKASAKNQSAVSSIFKDSQTNVFGFGSSLSSILPTITSPAGLVAGVAALGVGLIELSQQLDSVAEYAMQVENVFANVPIPIEAARSSTRGLISDFNLARLASDAVSLGVTDSSKSFADLASSLQKLGARRGVDALSSIESGLTAIGRGSTELLDNLGVVLKVEQAQRDYAKTLGKTTKELTEQEKAEAFRVIATEKVIEAAKSVTVSTDGAAAAVRRFNVELENIRDHALGGDVATLSLAEGLQQIQKDGPVNIENLKRYGVASADLRAQLRDLGVASKDIPTDIDKLGKAARSAAIDVKRLQYEEDQRRKALEKTPAFKAEEARLAAEQASLATAKERIIEIENEQAFLSSNNDAIAQKAKLQIESLQLQALILRATGDEAKAREIERQAELAQYRELSRLANEDSRRRGRGKKRDPYASERGTFQEGLAAARYAEQKRVIEQTVSLQRGYLASVQAFEKELAVAQAPQLDRAKAINAEMLRRNELQRSELERQKQLAQTQGDPAAAFALEQQQFQLREAALQRQLDLSNDIAEREALEDQISGVRHEARIARIEEEKRAREEAQRAIVSAIQSVSAAEKGAFQLSGTIAAAAIQGEERKKRVLDGIKAAGLYVDGAVAAAQSVIAFASGNIPQGIALAAAAANAIAQGSIIAAGNARGRSGGSAGSATQFSRGPDVERQRFSVERGAPISTREGLENNANNTTENSQRRSAGNVVNIHRIEVLGAIDDESAEKIRRGLQRRTANLG